MYRWIAILIWTALLVALPKLAYDDWEAVATLVQPAMVTEKVANSPLPTTSKTQSLSEHLLNLFGIITAEPKHVAQPAEELPVTRLDLQLAGTFTHKSHPKASALIAQNGKPSQRYYGGDTVAEGAELVKITKRSVVLRRNGRDEVLLFPRISPVKLETEKHSQSVLTASSSQKAAAQQLTSSQAANNATAPAIASSRQSAKTLTPPISSPANTRSELKARLQRLRERNK